MPPPLRLDYRPGINVELTPTANRGGYSQSNLIRWRDGKPEKLLGWAHICGTPLPGLCRALHFWTDLTGNAWVGCGTSSDLMVLLLGQTQQGGTLFNITPAGLLGGLSSSGEIEFSLRVWSLDNFGEDLIAVPSGGKIFLWVPTSNPALATVIPTAPPFNQGAFVVMPEEIIMAFGSSADGATAMDPLLLRWCAQANFNDWVPSATNQAGSFRLSRGNRIIGALQAPFGAMIWTDVDLWATQYLGFPLVFGFTQIMSNCGLISQKSAAVIGNAIYWLSDHGVFKMDASSGVQQVPCPVWDILFKNLDLKNEDKCFAAADALYNEVFFFFPSLSGGTGEIDSYIKVNTLMSPEQAWDYGSLVRTAWTDQNRPGPPFGVDQTGLIQQHDIARKGIFQLRLGHGIAAVFHHDGLAMKALDIRQRLVEHARLANELGQVDGAHRFSCTTFAGGNPLK